MKPDELSVKPLGQSRSRLADDVAHLLRELILSGELEPGTPLLQIQLAERLGVSRTPLREAFRTLERDGLVRISNGNKTVEVVSLTTHRLVETYQVRGVIDSLAAGLAARAGLTPDLDARLRSCVAKMEAATKPSVAIAEYGEAHADFHLTVLEASGNSCLCDFEPLVRMSSHMFLTRYLKEHQPKNVASTLERVIRVGNRDHRKIYDAIRKMDVATAEQIAASHIERTTKFAQSVADAEAAAQQQPA